MSNGNDDSSGSKPRPNRDGVSHDARGNAVWQWAVDSGRHLMESTSHLLKRLEVPGLKLEEDVTAKNKQPDTKPGMAPEVKGNAGYDPYGGRRAAPVSTARPPPARPAPARPAVARPVATKPAVAPPPRRSLWQRLFRKD